MNGRFQLRLKAAPRWASLLALGIFSLLLSSTASAQCPPPTYLWRLTVSYYDWDGCIFSGCAPQARQDVGPFVVSTWQRTFSPQHLSPSNGGFNLAASAGGESFTLSGTMFLSKVPPETWRSFGNGADLTIALFVRSDFPGSSVTIQTTDDVTQCSYDNLGFEWADYETGNTMGTCWGNGFKTYSPYSQTSPPQELYRTDSTIEYGGATYNYYVANPNFPAGNCSNIYEGAFDPPVGLLARANVAFTKTATILSSNRPPTVAVVGPCQVTVGQPMTFDAIGTDPDDDPLCYRWTVPGASSVIGDDTPNCMVTWDAAGTYSLSAEVRDPDGDHASDNVSVQVYPAGTPLSGGCEPLKACSGTVLMRRPPQNYRDMPEADLQASPRVIRPLGDDAMSMGAEITDPPPPFEKRCACCEFAQCVYRIDWLNDKEPARSRKLKEDVFDGLPYGHRRCPPFNQSFDSYDNPDDRLNGCSYTSNDGFGILQIGRGVKYDYEWHFRIQVRHVAGGGCTPMPPEEGQWKCYRLRGVAGDPEHPPTLTEILCNDSQPCQPFMDADCGFGPAGLTALSSTEDAVTVVVAGKSVTVRFRLDADSLMVAASIQYKGSPDSIPISQVGVEIAALNGRRFASTAVGDARGFEYFDDFVFDRPPSQTIQVTGRVDGETSTFEHTLGGTTSTPSAPKPTPVSWRIRPRQNPLRFGTGAFTCELPRDGFCRVVVCDAAGRRVRTIFNAWLPAGYRELHWDGRTDAGNKAGAGAYFVRLEGTGGRDAAKFMLLN